MNISYKGYDIQAIRDRALGGWESIYWSIFRESDGFECDSGFSQEDTTPIWQFVEMLKERVDNELAEDDPWMEKADNL